MNPDNTYLEQIKELISENYMPFPVAKLPKNLGFFSTEQIISKFSSFVPEGVLTKESVFETMAALGYELAEIKPFSYVWILQHKRS